MSSPVSLVLALALAAPSTSPSTPAPDIVVLPPVVEGNLSAPSRAQLMSSLRDTLADGGLAVAKPSTRSPCEDVECAAVHATSVGAPHAVLPTLSALERDYEVRLTVVFAESNERIELQQSCELCGLAEVDALVEEMGRTVVQRIAQRSARAKLSAVSEPAGALVLSDGVQWGLTPFVLEISPGTYTLTFSRDGYLDQQRDVVAVSGATAHVEVSLTPVPAQAPRKQTGLHVAGGVLDGLGVAAIGAGAALLVLDDRAYEPSCREPRDPVTGACRQRYDTLAGGTAAVVGGVVGLGIGIALHVIARRRSRRHKGTGPRSAGVSSSPTAAVLP